MKKVLSVVISIIILMSFSISALAEEEQPMQDIDNVLNLQVDDDFETEDLQEVDAQELVSSNCMPLNEPETNFDLKNATELGKLESTNKSRSASNSTQSVLGTIANEGDYVYSIISLEPNEAINVTMECPKNPELNYDLFLYEVDSEGYIGNMITGSVTETYMNTYPDGTTKTLDEAFSYKNNTTDVNYYAIIILAVTGGSTTDTFKLTVSLSNENDLDVAEPNDSPYYACELSEVGGGGTTFSNISLHVVNDQDWFLWRAPSDIAGVEVSVNLEGVNPEKSYNVEVYKAEGNKMVLLSRTGGGAYKIGSGVNYIRVYADEETFTASPYKLTLKPWSETAAKINVRLDGDEGDKQYASYPGGTYFRFQNKFCPEIQVLSESGYVVRNQLVTLTWQSGSWNEHTGNSSRVISDYTDDNGRVVLTLARDLQSPNDLPIALGYEVCYRDGAIKFVDYYDIDGIAITAGNAPAYTTVVYHLMRSDYAGS